MVYGRRNALTPVSFFRGAALFLALTLSLATAPHQGRAETFSEIQDGRTGVRLRLPLDILVKESATRWGTNWRTVDGAVNIDTLAFDEGKDFRGLYQTLKGIRGRQLELDRWTDSEFLLVGRDADGSRFSMVVRKRGAQIRGVSVVYAPRGAELAQRLFERVKEHFAPFPEDASRQPQAPAETVRQPQTPQQPVIQAGPITVQPNLGDVFQGSPDMLEAKFAPNGKYIAVSEEIQVKLWEIATGRPLRTLEHAAYFQHFTFIEDGAKIRSVHKDGQTRTWDPLTGRLLSETQQPDASSTKPPSSIKLRDNLQALPGGVLEANRILAKTGDQDCSADLVLATLANGRPVYTTLDKAPGCEAKPEGETEAAASPGAIIFAYNEARRTLYVSREQFHTAKVFDLGALRPGDAAVPAKTTEGPIVAADANNVLAAIAEGKGLRVIELDSGRTVSRLTGHGHAETFPIAAPDGESMMLFHNEGNVQRFSVWPIAGGAPAMSRARVPEGFSTYHAAPGANVVLAADKTGNFLLLSTQTGEEIAKFSIPAIAELDLARLSPDGKRAMLTARLQPQASGAGQQDETPAALLIDTGNGQILQEFRARPTRGAANPQDAEFVTSYGFSTDGQKLAVGWAADDKGYAEVWTLSPPRLAKRLAPNSDQTTSLTFSPDGRFLIGGTRDSGVDIWTLDDGKVMRTLDRESVAGHVSTGAVAMSQDSALIAFGPRQRATSSGDIGRERRVHVWDTASGDLRFLLNGHEENVNALIFTRDGRWLVSGSNDSSIRYWDRNTGRLAATYADDRDGHWVIITEEGFFAASPSAGHLLSVVRGFEATSIEQVWQTLYEPDLVRELLAGDPKGEAKLAAANANLAMTLESGPAPDVAIVSPSSGGVATKDIIEAKARITDRGKGVGRIEWRVNGVTAAVAARPEGAGPEFTVAQQLALDAGDNTIEIVAYNSANLLASPPVRSEVKLIQVTTAAKPTLHVLAIGVNAYADRGWTKPGTSETSAFSPLRLAVNDANAIGDALREAGVGLYAEVKVTRALDRDATSANLEGVIDRFAAGISPRDSVVLFAAGHGISVEGRFYLIPQDYQGGANPAALKERAIGQERLQNWIANKIKARKTIVLLDTCESGALVGGHVRSRFGASASQAAMGRLHEATGRPVLTAAAEGKVAYEGYEGHGAFTWALLDALRNGDRNGDGMIEMSELVTHVQDQVPRIAARLAGRGLALVAASRATDDAQSARFGSRGEDFPLTQRLK